MSIGCDSITLKKKKRGKGGEKSMFDQKKTPAGV